MITTLANLDAKLTAAEPSSNSTSRSPRTGATRRRRPGVAEVPRPDLGTGAGAFLWSAAALPWPNDAARLVGHASPVMRRSALAELLTDERAKELTRPTQLHSIERPSYLTSR